MKMVDYLIVFVLLTLFVIMPLWLFCKDIDIPSSMAHATCEEVLKSEP